MTDVDADGPMYVGPRVIDVGRRSELNRHTGPNGWFAGPSSAPDRFQLLGPGLGGGEGITWRARYRGSESTALALAVKQLRRPPGAHFDWPSPADLQRWDEQKELLQYLTVDHLATLLDIFVGAAPHIEGEGLSVDNPPDTPYVVMEWVPGRTLVDEFGGIPSTPSTLGVRLTHLQHVAGALHAVHTRTAYGTIGTAALLRDVKPDNCVLDPARGVVLVDIGTMRLVDDGYQHPGFHHPGYTAPEVLDDPVAPREASADLYSLGALAYFCVLGEDPPPLIGRAGAGQLIGRQLLSAARSARVADPHGFVDHLRLMLHPQPDERPADAVAWARRLRVLAARRGRLGTVGTRVALGASIAIVGGLALTATALREGLETGPGQVAASLEPEVLTTSAIPGTLTVPAAPASRSAAVTITAPAEGSDVKQCELIEGTTSNLPAGTTLVLSSVDLSARTDGEQIRRLSPVDGWQTPSSLKVWRTPQQFGPATPAGVSSASSRAGPTPAGSSKAGSNQTGSNQAGSSRDGSSRDGSSKAGSSRERSSNAGSSRDGSSKAGSSRDGSSKAGSRDGSSNAGSNKAGSRDRSSNAASNKAGSRKAGSNRAGPSVTGAPRGPRRLNTKPQRFRVDVLVVDLAALKRVVSQAREDGVDWRSAALPETAVGASITFNRVPGACSTP
jgi:eukaryotic-like serine/threonine-protein kinase